MSFPLRVKAVTIDLDGTLADSIPDLAAAANMMLRDLGRPELPVERITDFVGKGIPRLVERSLAGTIDGTASTEEMSRALPVFERFYTEVNGRHSVLYPGVKEGLEEFRAMQMPLACVTNKSGRFTMPLLKQLGIAQFFEQIIGGDALPQKKPHPAQLLHACKGFGIKPAEMLMIGDSVNDAQAARAAGCPVFCVPYGYNEGRPVQSLDCDGIVSSLDELPERLRLG